MIYAGERPGIYIDYDSSSVGGGNSAANSVVIAAKLISDDRVKTFFSKGMAMSDPEVAGDKKLREICAAAFGSGAKTLHILPVVGGSAEDYFAAFKRVGELSGVAAIVCDSPNTEAIGFLKEYLAESAAAGKEYIGFAYQPGTDAALSAAASLGCERICLVCQGGAPLAAAVASAVCATEISDPLYGLEISGAQGLDFSLDEDGVNALIAGGVTPLEILFGKVYSIRTVSTRASSDRSMLDLQTVRAIDSVLGGVRGRLNQMVGSARNNARSRLAVSTQAGIVLEEMYQNGLLAGYEAPVVTASSEDPTACRVALGFTIARGICRIYISATVSV